ncbi:MAG TPA: NAD(P)H-dependent oxidoreductase [Novosphingobium sp.]|nr:NAD(P)H-dependent oxidoreductase [Novosphingobium sp.]HZV09029.1 NAD(P)H-dependent oxidoreductase [Novosphingobium sp.]
MNLMHVDSSPKGEISNSRLLSRYFVDQLAEQGGPLEVDYLDLAHDCPPHVTGDFARATYTPAEARTAEMHALLAPSDRLCERLLAADALVFAMPMYNWSMPSNFKAFIDAIVRTGITYVMTPDGRYEGQLGGRPVLFITTRGADLGPGSPFAAMDALTPALRAAFGFIGVADPLFVDAQPVQFADPEARLAALDRARAQLSAIAGQWARQPARQPA